MGITHTKTRLFLDWMDFGYGYDLLAGERREVGIFFKEKPKNVLDSVEQNKILEAEQLSSYFSFQNILSTPSFELNRSIVIELLRELLYGKGFGIGSKIITFLDSFSINRYSIFLTVRDIVIVNHKSLEVKEISLSEEATKFLKNNDPKGFRDRYGDESIVGIAKGGIYLINLEITTGTKEERQEIINQLKPNGASKIKLSNMITVLSNINGNKININTFQQGGDKMTPVAKASEMVETLNKFSNSVNEENALPLIVTTMPYFEVVPENETPPHYAEKYDSMLKFADECNRIFEEMASLQYIANHSDEFNITFRDIFNKIPDLRDRLKEILTRHREEADKCFSFVGGCSFMGGDSIASDLPERK